MTLCVKQSVQRINTVTEIDPTKKLINFIKEDEKA